MDSSFNDSVVLDMDSFPNSFWIVFGEDRTNRFENSKGIMIFNRPFLPANIMEYQPRAGPTGFVDQPCPSGVSWQKYVR